MKRFFFVYFSFFKQQVKALIEYKVDFALGIVGLVIEQLSSFLLIFTVFTQIESLGKFSFDEVLFLYGYSQIIRGIDHIYNDNIWHVAWQKIRKGDFSTYLIRPINVLAHIIFEKVNFDGLGELAIGLIIFIYAKSKLNIYFSFMSHLILILFIVMGLIIYFSLKVILASIAFWTISSGELMSVLYEINTFSKYPLEIFKSRVLKFILIYIIPFLTISYYPTVYFIKEEQNFQAVPFLNIIEKNQIISFILLISLVMLLFSLFIWNKGLKKYESTGT